MQAMLKNFSGRSRWPRLAVFMLAGLLFLAFSAAAQPDDFANAQLLFGTWGSVTNDNSAATAEAGEPPHAGKTATQSLWYVWTAPQDGEVSVDTLGSVDALGANLDTVLSVYIGGNLSSLAQV